PFDKTVTFLAADQFPRDLPIPHAYPELEELRYLGGHSLGDLLRAEHAATAAALASHGRMNMTIRLPRIDAHAVGQLIMALQIATIYAGALYRVDPLDQPGVELGKALTYGLLGREGYAPPAAAQPDPRWVAR
ncbi:MAG TPA: hypothetical protein VF192_14810, partial [Longimicrobiales bacterium]